MTELAENLIRSAMLVPMSKVQEQIAELTRHLYEQHQAEKRDAVGEQLHLVRTLEAGVYDAPPTTYSRPLAPGAHPPIMGARYVPQPVVQASVHTREEALAAVERMFPTEIDVFKTEYLGKFPEPEDVEDDVPSIEAPAEIRVYKRKLEP